jgi:hypothetical protein
MTRFWAQEQPGDAASVFSPDGAKPAAAGSDDDGVGELEEDDALAVRGFGGPASTAGAVAGRAWWDSADAVGDTQGGVSLGADDDVAPGFGGGNEVLRLGSGRGGLMANAGVRQNAPSTLSAAAVDDYGPHGGQQADDLAYRRGGGRHTMAMGETLYVFQLLS